jgi:DnaJ-class molecular chaperone
MSRVLNMTNTTTHATCGGCNGHGTVTVNLKRGRTRDYPCPTCKGTGQVTTTSVFRKL